MESSGNGLRTWLSDSSVSVVSIAVSPGRAQPDLCRRQCRASSRKRCRGELGAVITGRRRASACDARPRSAGGLRGHDSGVFKSLDGGPLKRRQLTAAGPSIIVVDPELTRHATTQTAGSGAERRGTWSAISAGLMIAALRSGHRSVTRVYPPRAPVSLSSGRCPDSRRMPGMDESADIVFGTALSFQLNATADTAGPSTMCRAQTVLNGSAQRCQWCSPRDAAVSPAPPRRCPSTS